jgi:hypothetical protein
MGQFVAGSEAIQRLGAGQSIPIAPNQGRSGVGMTDRTVLGAIGGSGAVIAADYAQTRGTPSYRVWLRGYAIRAGYDVPIPALDTLGGVKAVWAGGISRGGFKKNVGGVPVFARNWCQEYILLQAPTQAIVTPANPAELWPGG